MAMVSVEMFRRYTPKPRARDAATEANQIGVRLIRSYVAVEMEVTHGTEGQMVALEDSPDLVVGADILVDGDAEPWTVTSVHRCVERPDGTQDHSLCFV